MLILISIILISIYGFYHLIAFLIDLQRLRYYINKIPGPPCLPIIGNTLEITGTPDKLWANLRAMSKKYYPIYKLWFTKYAVVSIFDPDDVEILLTSQKNITKSTIYDFLLPWFGTGLLTSTGRKWQLRRKILTSSFHFHILREFTDTFNEEGRRMIEELGSHNGDITLNLTSFITKYTLDTICETAMGTSLAKMERENNNFHHIYKKSIDKLGKMIVYRLQHPWLHPDFLFPLTPWGRLHDKCLNIVRGFSKKIIDERKKFHEETEGIHLKGLNENSDVSDIKIFKASKKKLAMLDLLIAAMKNNYIDDEGIWDEVDTFLFEGHDTTAMGICFTLLLLAEHRDIQQRAREEVDEVLKNTAGSFSITDLQQLSYLERCIKEALRLYPSVPFISRSITDDMQLKNYLIPKGSIVHLHIFDVHRDEHFWPDPLRYDPDRFLPENIEKRHPFSYVPFSGGPRNCIGQKFGMLELKTIVGHLLHNFYLEPIDLAVDVCIVPDVILRPKHSIQLKLVPRQLP